MLAAGISANTVGRLVRCGRLTQVHRSVYAVSGRVAVPLADETAVLLAMRDGTALSGETAASLWRLIPAGAAGGLIHVTVPGASPGARLRGVRTHRTTSLDPRDVRIHQGLPVTSPARTLLDIAPSLSMRALERAVSQALYPKLVKESELADLRRRCVGRRGCRRLAALLDSWDEPAMTRSEAEELFLSLVRAAELPTPEVNTDWESRERDFRWPQARLIVEIDGWASHGQRPAFEGDRRRDAQALALGSSTMRITWRQLKYEPLATMVSLAQAITAATLTNPTATPPRPTTPLSARSTPDPS